MLIQFNKNAGGTPTPPTVIWYEVTRADALTLIAGNLVVKGAGYRITDKNIVLYGDNDKAFKPTGIFFNGSFQDSILYDIITDIIYFRKDSFGNTVTDESGLTTINFPFNTSIDITNNTIYGKLTLTVATIKEFKNNVIYCDSAGNSSIKSDSIVINNNQFLDGVEILTQNVLINAQTNIKNNIFQKRFTLAATTNNDVVIEENLFKGTFFLQQITLNPKLLITKNISEILNFNINNGGQDIEFNGNIINNSITFGITGFFNCNSNFFNFKRDNSVILNCSCNDFNNNNIFCNNLQFNQFEIFTFSSNKINTVNQVTGSAIAQLGTVIINNRIECNNNLDFGFFTNTIQNCTLYSNGQILLNNLNTNLIGQNISYSEPAGVLDIQQSQVIGTKQGDSHFSGTIYSIGSVFFNCEIIFSSPNFSLQSSFGDYKYSNCISIQSSECAATSIDINSVPESKNVKIINRTGNIKFIIFNNDPQNNFEFYSNKRNVLVLENNQTLDFIQASIINSLGVTITVFQLFTEQEKQIRAQFNNLTVSEFSFVTANVTVANNLGIGQILMPSTNAANAYATITNGSGPTPTVNRSCFAIEQPISSLNNNYPLYFRTNFQVLTLPSVIAQNINIGFTNKINPTTIFSGIDNLFGFQVLGNSDIINKIAVAINDPSYIPIVEFDLPITIDTKMNSYAVVICYNQVISQARIFYFFNGKLVHIKRGLPSLSVFVSPSVSWSKLPAGISSSANCQFIDFDNYLRL